MNRYAIWVIVALFVALAGYNTMEGLGKDLQKAGEKIEKRATK